MMNEWLERNRGYIIVTLLNLIFIGGAVFFLRRPQPAAIEILLPTPTATPEPTATPRPLMVYVSGAVVQPDVYTLPPESIVKDAIVAAGGTSAEADLNRINLARRLRDEEQVYVPKLGEESPLVAPPLSDTSAPSPSAQPGAKVNINTATAAELETLPRIGPALAQRIIEYRTDNGPFGSIEEIKNVKGIGQATFEQLKDEITVQ